jgi:hypothetical protein
MGKRKKAKVELPIETPDISDFFDSLPDGLLLELGEIEAERAITRRTVLMLWEKWAEEHQQKLQKHDSKPETAVDQTETKGI